MNLRVRPLTKYALLEVPGWFVASGALFAAHRWLGLPADIAWALLAVWIGKDVALYPLVRGALTDSAL